MHSIQINTYQSYLGELVAIIVGLYEILLLFVTQATASQDWAAPLIFIAPLVLMLL
jgi:hypothetical protein